MTIQILSMKLNHFLPDLMYIITYSALITQARQLQQI